MLLPEPEVRGELSNHPDGHSETAPTMVKRVLVLPTIRSSNLITKLPKTETFLRRFNQGGYRNIIPDLME